MKLRGLSWKLAVAAGATFAMGQVAAQNLLVNGSFEQGAWVLSDANSMVVYGGSSAITGWQVVGAGVQHVAWSNTPSPDLAAQDGNFALDLTGWTSLNTTESHPTMQQSFATTAGASYLVSFYMGAIPLYGDTVQILASAGNQQGLVFTQGPVTQGGWEQRSFTFVAQGAMSTLQLTGIRADGDYYIGLDNVSVTAAIPEPQTYAMMLAGLAAVGAAARRRKKQG